MTVNLFLKSESCSTTEKSQNTQLIKYGRTKNDPAKQVKVASEYVELVGMKHGVNRFNRDTTVGYLSYDDISKSLGVSKSTLKDLLEIDRKLIPQIRELFDNGEINKKTANKVWCKLSPEDQEKFFNEIGRDKISQMTQAQTQKYIDDLKQGRRYLELERIYGIKNGGDRKSNHNSCDLITQSDLAKKEGISVNTWNNKKNLTKLIPELQQLMLDKKLSTKVALIYSAMPHEEQLEIYNEFGEKKVSDMTYDQTKKEVELLKDKAKQLEIEKNQLKTKTESLEVEKQKLQQELQREKCKQPEIKVVEKV